jgi:hypothetical protein
MWGTVVNLNDLNRSTSWRPESFCVEGVSIVDSSYSTAPLGSMVVERRETVEPQNAPNQKIFYIGLENVEPITGRLLDVSLKDSKEIRSRSKLFAADDVLYGRLRAYLNKVYLATEPVKEGLCSTEFFVLTPDYNRVDPIFLRALLSSAYVVQHVEKWQTGSALPRVHLTALLDIEVPLPPLAVQKIYVEFLREHAKKQRTLAEELATLPTRIMDGLVTALQSGTEGITLPPAAPSS